MKEIKFDILGRVCIPKQMRDSLGLVVNTTCFIEQDGDKIIITKDGGGHTCPVCNKKFSSEYIFCPFDGQFLYEKEKEKKLDE